ncbi:MAG: polymerase, sigma-24 subunit, subfamily [Frankiales bacterium]|nr:polymerase, sigma-24 subunit, subfamily [Frankiales bacterium]
MDEQGREVFRAYVAARSPGLLRTAYLLTGSRSDAEDLLQTALAKTYLAWDRIRDREALDGYVRRIMVNTHTSWWRRRKVDEYATDELPERSGSRDATEDLALHDALWTALSSLPKRQRAMVVLRYYEDLSEAATAQILGVSVGTVKSATSRALAKLRDTSGLRDDPRAVLPTDGVLT